MHVPTRNRLCRLSLLRSHSSKDPLVTPRLPVASARGRVGPLASLLNLLDRAFNHHLVHVCIMHHKLFVHIPILIVHYTLCCLLYFILYYIFNFHLIYLLTSTHLYLPTLHPPACVCTHLPADVLGKGSWGVLLCNMPVTTACGARILWVPGWCLLCNFHSLEACFNCS